MNLYYLFPVGTISSFILVDFMAAKSISTGATLYEWGPKYIIGTCKDFMMAIVPVDTWYGALSKVMTVSYRHKGLSLSSFLTKSLMYIAMILESVLTWVNEAYRLPRVSKAIIIVILGNTCFFATELVVPNDLHFMRL